MAIKLQPMADRLVVKPIEKEEVTKGGIVLPDTAKEKPQEGKVLAVGPGRLSDDGKRIAMDVSVGDIVIYAKYGGTEIKVDGEDLVIRVPPGTLIYDTDLNLLLKDMNEVGLKVCVCRGGKGGRGNKAFATATNQTPRNAELGKKGQERNIRLELKLIADVGLVGMPNAGKSTLISRCSAARPKIADYPFTTVEPVLGIVELTGFRRFVMADIPGLIEGAHEGTGLGDKFLKHIERTAILTHVLDIMPTDGSDPVENYNVIRHELEQYSKALAKKHEVIIANKTDLDPDGKAIEELRKKLKKEIHPISAVTGSGTKELSELLWQKVKELKKLS